MTTPSDDYINKLERLAALREKGMLTEDEFRAQKATLLGTPSPTPVVHNTVAPAQEAVLSDHALENKPSAIDSAPVKKSGCVIKFIKIYIGILVIAVVLGAIIGLANILIGGYEPSKKDSTPPPVAEEVQPDPAPVAKPEKPAPAPKAVRHPELPWTPQEVIALYNVGAPLFELPRVDIDSVKPSKGVAEAWNYPLSQYTVMVFSTNLGGSKMTGVNFAGVPDGTLLSGATITISAMCAIVALTPDATGDQRSDLFIKLGIFDPDGVEDITDGKERTAYFGPVRFTSVSKPIIGVFLSASPK